MANSKLVKTNLLVSVILLIGFMLTAFFSHRANYRVSLNNIEQVSSLTMDGIYYQILMMRTMFRPSKTILPPIMKNTISTPYFWFPQPQGGITTLTALTAR